MHTSSVPVFENFYVEVPRKLLDAFLTKPEA